MSAAIDDLCARIHAAEWLELPVTAVAPALLAAAVAAGRVAVMTDVRGVAMLRLSPDIGVEEEAFDAVAATAEARRVWRQRMKALIQLLPGADGATQDALESAISHAARQCGMFWEKQ